MASRMGVQVLLVAVAMVVGFAAAQTTDTTTNYSVSSSSSGGVYLEAGRCISPGRCFLKLLTCPRQCGSRSTTGPGAKACFIDCVKCETTCKHRKPNCWTYGSMCYDPRLVGGDGSMFYFHGEKDQDFCLISDRSLHINGHFIGLKPEGRTRDYTWVQALGVLFGSHKLSVGAKKVAHWSDDVDQLMFSYDGVAFDLKEEVGAKWISQDGQISVSRTYERNVVEVIMVEMATMLLEVVPITPQEDKAHNYQLPSDDVFAHLDLQFKFFNLSANVNGVLGQTYQPNYVSAAKVGVPMPVLGGEDRFLASGLLKADCKATQFFARESEQVDEAEILMPFSTDCSSKSSGSGIVCRR